MALPCRLCLSESEKFVDVSEVREGLPLSVIAMIICPIKIESSDNLPKQICADCLEVLINAYKLRDVSNSTDRYLRGYISEVHEIEILEDVKVATIEKVVEHVYEESECKNEDIVEDDEDALSKDEDYVVYESGDEEVLTETAVLELDPNFKYEVDCQNVLTKKSAVWNYIGYLSENGQIVESEKDFYYCKICVEQNQTLKPKYKVESTATSVLFAHLSKIHNLSKDEMAENPSFNPSHQVAELVNCEICSKSVNSGSLNIHMTIEHEHGAASRQCEKKSQYRVNCFRASNKSLAWDYFGVLLNENGEQIDEYYYYCRLCVEEEGKMSPKYTKNTSTSILLQHLKNAHLPKTPEELAKRKLPEPINFRNNSKRLKSEEFTCRLCEEKLESKKALNRHLAKEHDEEPARDFTCDIDDCGKSFTARDTLLKHIRNVHQPTTKYPCNQCPTMLSSRMSLRRHVESCHLKIKTFSCEHCEAVYSEAKSLKNHVLKIHLGVVENKIACGVCGMKLPNQWSLRRHHLTHTREVS
jgi:Zinc-finger associated domain (zf-AD)/Zinc finger, C2H2 type